MSGNSPRRDRRRRPTPLGWMIIGIAVLVAVGFLIGSKAVWIPALIALLLILLGTFGVPRNVRDLNVPPGMINAPGDVTRHHGEDED